MSGFPTANFSDSAQGLFTATEIRSLMRVEYERAARYDYPVGLMMIDVDRLEYLHDLYGYESREEILQAVIQLLRGVTRASDFLGCMNEGKLMALFPHTSQDAATALADRLLVGSRRLKFESGTRTLRTTLSIGLVVATADPMPWEDFVQTAENALAFAMDSGGDRFVQREGAEQMLDRLREDIETEEAALIAERARLEHMRAALPHANAPVQPTAAIRPPDAGELKPAPVPRSEQDAGQLRFGAVGAEGEPTAVPFDPADRARFTNLVASIFENLGERTPAVQDTFNQTVELLVQTAGAARVHLGNSHAKAVSTLERRVSKLKEALQSAENEVRRVAAMKETDPGLASIYRSVQGLDEHGEEQVAKREMLSVLFEANVKLREDIKSKDKS